MIILTGCAMTPITTTDNKYIPIPTSLYPVCYKTPFEGSTVGQRLLWAEQIEKDYDECIEYVDTLIEFMEQSKEKDDG